MKDSGILLDTAITPELREKGIVREARRLIQGARKEAKLQPSDLVSKMALFVLPDDVVVLQKHIAELQDATRVRTLEVHSSDILKAIIEE